MQWLRIIRQCDKVKDNALPPTNKDTAQDNCRCQRFYKAYKKLAKVGVDCLA